MPVTKDQVDEARRLYEEFPEDGRLAELAVELHDQYEREGAQRREGVANLFRDRVRHGLGDEQLAQLNQVHQGDVTGKYRNFNDAFFREFIGVNDEQLKVNGVGLRRAYSKQIWGEEIADDVQFYDRVANDITFGEEVGKRAMQSVLAGKRNIDALGEMAKEFANDKTFQSRKKSWQDQFLEQSAQAQSRMSPYMPLMRDVAAQLQSKMGVAEGATVEDGSYRELAQLIMEVPKEDRKLVIAGIAAMGATDGSGNPLTKLAESFGRGVEDYFENIPAFAGRDYAINVKNALRAGVQVPAEIAGDPKAVMEYTMNRVSETMAQGEFDYTGATGAESGEVVSTSDDVKAEALKLADELIDAIDLRGELRTVAEQNIDPITSDWIAMRGLYAASRSMPYTIASLSKIGIAANAVTMAEQAYQSLRRNNPDMTAEQAQGISTIAGPLMAATEVMSAKLLTGQLPFLNRFVNQVTLTAKSNTARYGTRALGASVLELGQENVQDLTPDMVQGVFSALSQDVPGVKWRERFGELARNQGEIFFAVLPLALFGAGIGTWQDYRGAKLLVSDYDLLVTAGVSEADASEIRAKAIAGDMESAQTLLRKSFAKTGGDQTDVAAQIREAAPKFRAKIEEARRREKMSGDLDILPKILSFEGKTVLQFEGGEAVEFDTHAEAMERWGAVASSSVARLHQDLITSVRRATRNMESGREFRFVQSPLNPNLRDMQQEGTASEKQVEERGEIEDADQEFLKQFQTAEVLSQIGASSEEDALAAQTVLGSSDNVEVNRGKYGEKVIQTTVRLFQQGTPLTVFEESAEGDAKVMIRNGQRQWLAENLFAIDQRMKAGLFRSKVKSVDDVTNQDIVEAYSKMVVGYYVGRDGMSEMSPQFQKLFQSEVQKAFNGTMTGYAGLFGAIMKRAEMVEKARLGGDLGAIEEFLAKSIGMTEQGQFERTVVKEGEKIAESMGVEFVDEQTFSTMSRDPELTKAAQDLKQGIITADEYQSMVDSRMPLREFDEVPIPATQEDMLRGLGDRKAGDVLKRDLIKNPEDIEDGMVLEARLDIPAYESENVWVVSLHHPRNTLNKGQAGKVFGYTPTSVLREVEFGVTESAALGIAAGKPKSTIATMRGEYVPMTSSDAYELAVSSKGEWVEIGMNPVRHSFFYDKRTQTPVESAAMVVQVGGMVLAKDPVFGNRSDYTFSTMRLSEQDRRYLELAKDPEANRDELQRMVDRAADRSGYFTTPFYHGTGNLFTVFNLDKLKRVWMGKGFHFAGKTLAKKYADQWDGRGEPRLIKAYLAVRNPAPKEVYDRVWRENNWNDDVTRDALVEMGYDGTRYRHEKWMGTEDSDLETTVAFYPSQIKSADPVTYDEQGNVIPLSQRFDQTRDEITFSVADFSNSRAVPADAATVTVLPDGSRLVGPTTFSIMSWHGTPHKIDPREGFRIDRIGTGDGSQAFGWGLYTAEDQRVAVGYQKGLAKWTLDGRDVAELRKKFPSSNMQLAISEEIDIETASERFQKMRPEIEALNAIIDYADNAEFMARSADAKQLIREWTDSGRLQNQGNLYKIEIQAELDEFLDWDKPLSEQSERVQSIIKSAGIADSKKKGDAKLTGKDIYGDTFSESAKTTSETLLALGIKGIRYADGNTRRPADFDSRLNNLRTEVAELKETIAKNEGKPWDMRQQFEDWLVASERDLAAMEEQALVPQTYNYVIFDPAIAKFIEENGQPVDGGTTFSTIRSTVAPVRTDDLDSFDKKEWQKREGAPKFVHLDRAYRDTLAAFGIPVIEKQAVVGGWFDSEKKTLSLEVPLRVEFDTDFETARLIAGIVAMSAPELQNSAFVWMPLEEADVRVNGYLAEVKAKSSSKAKQIADLWLAENPGSGFTFDPSSGNFQTVIFGSSQEERQAGMVRFKNFVETLKQNGLVTKSQQATAQSGSFDFPGEADYEGILRETRDHSERVGGEKGKAIGDIAARAERRLASYRKALEVQRTAVGLLKGLEKSNVSTDAIISDLSGMKFANIRDFSIWLDNRFSERFGTGMLEVGSDQAFKTGVDALVYDVLSGLATDGSGSGWYDDRIRETLKELESLHPELETDPFKAAVFFTILASTSQGYTVTSNFEVADAVYQRYKEEGRIPTDMKFAQSSAAINGNLEQAQKLIDDFGIEWFTEFMDAEVTGGYLRDEIGLWENKKTGKKTPPTGVTLDEVVRGNRILGPKIGSFFNNLRGRFDTVTMDLWFTRTMHRYIGETALSIKDEKMQKYLNDFRSKFAKSPRKYGFTEKDMVGSTKEESDEKTLRAALDIFNRWGADGYQKFKGGYALEKAARSIKQNGTMKGAPQNKRHRKFFESIVVEANRILNEMGLEMTVADIQAIVWYAEKNLFATAGVASNAAKPADYLDAAMALRNKMEDGTGVWAKKAAALKSETASDSGTSFSVVRTTGDIDTRFASMFSPFVRSPELRPKLGEMARERGAKVLREVLPYILQQKRSIASIDREARSIEAFEYDRLLRETFNANSPEEQEALPPVDRQAARSEAQSLAEKWKAQKMREKKKAPKEVMIGHLRTLDAILRALPAEVRGKIGGFVAIAKLTDPDAMLDEIEARVKKIDIEVEKWLRKEAETRRKKLFKQAEPVRDAAGKAPKGKAGADIHDLFRKLKEAMLWDGDTAEAWALGLEARIASGELSPEEEAHAQIEANLVRMFSEWKGADAARRTAAVDAAEEAFREGYMREKERVAREREIREQDRAEIMLEIGGTGNRAERKAKERQDATRKGRAREWLRDLFGFAQVVGEVVGDDSKWKNWFADREREASNQKEDEVQQITDDLEQFFADLAGGTILDGEKLLFRLSQPSIDTSAGPMAELEAITAILMWRQEDGRRHMKGKRDEKGNVISTWSYDQGFVDLLEASLSREGAAVLDYLTLQYSEEYDTLNPVFREIYGINLPRHLFYSPLTVKPQQVQQGQMQDPVTGSTMSTASMTPGSLRTRAQVVAEPDFRNAVEVFLGHKKQLAHWKAYAKFSKEAQARLGNREVRNAIEAKEGQEAVKVLQGWLDYFAQGGTRDAAAHYAITKGLNRIYGRAASMALVGRIGTLAVQVTQLAAATAKMPVGAYITRLGKLLTGNLGWGDALDSDYIQRRIKQMPASLQVAMDGLRASAPNRVKHAVREIGKLLSGADGLATAGTYAIVYDYQLKRMREMGLSDAAAREEARLETERILDEIAQPTRPGTRSIREVTTTDPLAKVGWAFASEARKNLALLFYSALNREGKDAARAALYVLGLNAVLSSLIRSAWRDMRDDDDEEFFDERNWGPRKVMLAMATDWMSGIPLVGEEVQNALFRLSGEYVPNGSMISALGQAPGAALDLLPGGDAADSKDVEVILMAMGLGSDSIAAAASLMHIYRDLEGLTRNLID